MNLRLGGGRRAFEEIEVAAFVGLAHVLRKDGAVSAFVFPLRPAPRRLAAGELVLRHLEVELALLDVELDQISGLYQRERAADVGLRRDMQYARAIARAAHARIGDAH